MPPITLTRLVKKLEGLLAGSEVARPREVRDTVNSPGLPLVRVVYGHRIIFDLNAVSPRSFSNHGSDESISRLYLDVKKT